MRRRAFLELLAASSFAATAPLAQEVFPPPPQMVLLTVAGINATTDAKALGAVLSTLVVRDVPVNLVVDSSDPATFIDPASEIAQLLRKYVQSFSGLVEVIAWSPDLGQLTPYRAARQAHEARKKVYAALDPGGGVLPRVQSIACRAALGSDAASAVLSAGFRCVLEMPSARLDFRQSPERITARLDGRGVLSLLGGEMASFPDAARILAQPTSDRQRHLVFAAAELASLSADRLAVAAQEIGRFLEKGALELSSSAVLASDVQMRNEASFRRRIALHVLAETDVATGAFGQMLKAQGVPFSWGRLSGDFPGLDHADLALWVPMDLPSERKSDIAPPIAIFSNEPVDLASPNNVQADEGRFGIAVRLVKKAARDGLTDEAGLGIRVLARVGFEGGTAGLSLEGEGDGALLVNAGAFEDTASQVALVNAIKQEVMRPDVRLMPLQDYCTETLPREPLLPMLLMARAKALQPAPLSMPPDRAELLEDASAAWGYFETNTLTRTGLCPATVVIGGGADAGFPSVSMWEMGSHLNALMAAVDLGLLQDQEFLQRTDRLLQTLDRESRKRLALPPETIDARTGKGTARFNSFDCGRLLIALHRLSLHRLAPNGVAGLVGSWAFDEVIRNRRLHSYRDRTLIEDFRSNYSHYAASAMRLWGFGVASPLDGIDELGSADAQERLLALTSAFGVLGAEPSFLQLLELQDSPTQAFLADCIDILQRRLAETTGILAAPSETPLDQSPWFIYQGFDFRRIDDPWRVDVMETPDEAKWTGNVEGLKATSTKAAYLWHSLRPNAHSQQLLHNVRAAARQKGGFASAVYVADQRATAGYSDLNTNAIILQSIAHMLA